MKNRAAYFGVFTALALIFSYVEMLIPIQFGIPGIKLGLANLLIVIMLYKCGAKEALLLSVVRIVLAGFIFGNMFRQLFIAMVVVETFKVGYYLPVLLIAGVITGALIGLISGEVLKRLKNMTLM